MKIHEAIKCIRDHPLFKDIDTAKPLTVSQGGQQVPFELESLKKAIGSNAGCYRCGCNIWWSDLIWMANHRVPVNVGQVKAIQKTEFSSPPSTFPFTVTVAVDKEALASKPEGGWQRLSPAEPVHALLLSIQHDIQSNVGEQRLKEWRRVCLTVSFTFEAVTAGEARFWRAQNLREQAVNHGLVVRMSLRQRIYDVAGFKMSKEKASGHEFGAEKVAQAYTQQLKLAVDAEPISKSFVEDACHIHRRLLSLEPCQQILEWADRELLRNNPWKSIYALKALLDRASTSDNIIWCMLGMMDGFRMNIVDLSHFAVQKVKDSRQSYVEVLKLKKKVKEHLLQEWLQGLDIEAKWKNGLRDTFSSFESVRKKYAPYPASAAPDSAWMVGCPESVNQVTDIIEQLVYNQAFDNRYRDAVKAKHELEDFLGYPTVAKLLQDAEAQVRSEKKPAAESNTSVEDQQQWRQHMLKTIRAHIRLIPEGKSQAELEQALKDTGYATLKGDPTGQVLLHFDIKKFGEPLTRKQRVRGTGTLKQVETCLVLSSKKLTLPVRTRKHFQGSSNGDLLLGVAWPKLAEEWHVKWQEKKEMLGKKHLVPVGGKTADDAGDRTSNRAANELEPMCYHSLPLAFYEEILHGYYAKMVVDMTPSDARFAWACLRTRTGYVGICFTEAHVRGLENRLLELLKEDMVDPNSPLFSAAYSEAVGLKKTPSQGSGGPDPKAASAFMKRAAQSSVAASAIGAAVLEEKPSTCRMGWAGKMS
ncbi:Uncharacterized protein SCF082_LOCUS22412 [Durusdinium trenchii]|uniref:Uncharacterized protein n=1 Tax=Durusdinium trenchii TaxID=1381693 RepID=A0ABP0LI75_9DINO